uniref:Uncharacterized protein n=1 Tax=Rhizophora mucronata TaxID=61149 RepID=A0A2P2N729_RHIMU
MFIVHLFGYRCHRWVFCCYTCHLHSSLRFFFPLFDSHYKFYNLPKNEGKT